MTWIKRWTDSAKTWLQSGRTQKLLFWLAAGMISVALLGFGATAFIDREVGELEDVINHRRGRLRGAMQLQQDAIEVHQRIQQSRALIDMLREQEAEDHLILQHEMVLLQEHIGMANLSIESAVAASVISGEEAERLHSQLHSMHQAILKKGSLAGFYLNPSAGFNQIDEMLGRKVPEDKRKELRVEWRITGHMIRKHLGATAAHAWHLAEDHILKVDDGIEKGADEIKKKTRLVNSWESWKFRILVASMCMNTLGLLVGFFREYFDKFRETLIGSTS